jgi:outer membrane protein TolC
MTGYRLFRAGAAALVVACVPLMTTAQGVKLVRDEPDEPPRKMPEPRPRKPVDPQRLAELEKKVGQLLPPNPPSLLAGKVQPIDLAAALKLAGVENPDILIARQRVVLADAVRQRAAAMILPNINAGMNFDGHNGNLQQSTGNILNVNRDALYVGLGAGAVGSGTVTVPGIQYNLNVSQAIFGALIARQVVAVRQFDSIAVQNDVLLQVATAYVGLLRAEGRRAVALKNREDIREIARLTTVFALTGEGKQADADRAITELNRRNDEVLSAEAEVLTASAALARLLSLDPSCRPYTTDGWVVPAPIVPDAIPLKELLFIAIHDRPELAARRAAIVEATLAVRDAQWLPFSPNVILGYSAGSFGGGSNLVAQPGGFGGFQESRFGNFADRSDVDAVVYWTAQNMGVGNLALVRIARANRRISDLDLVVVLNQVRAEVATAQARTHARYAQIDVGERAVRSGEAGYKADFTRVRLGNGLPIELVDSFRLLADARFRYLDAITDYNRAQFELYVALGKPPANVLARPVPASLVAPGLNGPAPLAAGQ